MNEVLLISGNHGDVQWDAKREVQLHNKICGLHYKKADLGCGFYWLIRRSVNSDVAGVLRTGIHVNPELLI